MWHVNGGSGIRLTDETVNASWPEPSPDGGYLYYEERVAEGFGDPNPANAIISLEDSIEQPEGFLRLQVGVALPEMVVVAGAQVVVQIALRFHRMVIGLHLGGGSQTVHR